MNHERATFKQSVQQNILLLYFLPILAYWLYGYYRMDQESAWWYLLGGFLIAVVCSLLLILKVLSWESKIASSLQPVVPVAAAPSPQVEDTHDLMLEKEIHLLQENLTLARTDEASLKSQIAKLEEALSKDGQQAANLEEQNRKLQHDFELFVATSQEQAKKKDILLAEYAQTVNELRSTMDNKQSEIERLERSVSDLNYDVSTLVQLSNDGLLTQLDGEEAPKAALAGIRCPPIDPVQLLRRSVNMAQKMTGRTYFGDQNPFEGVPLEHFALDERRLYDAFQGESGGILALWSRREGGFDFVSSQINDALGWSSSKFIESFSDIVVEGKAEWEEALRTVAQKSEIQVPLLCKRKNGEQKLLHAWLASVPTGLFKNQVVVVFTS